MLNFMLFHLKKTKTNCPGEVAGEDRRTYSHLFCVWQELWAGEGGRTEAEEENYPDSSGRNSFAVQIAPSLERLCGRMQMPANARPLRNSASPRLQWSHLPPRNAGNFCSLRPTTGSGRKCLPEPCWDPGYREPLSEADRERTRVWGSPSWTALTSATSLELRLSARNRTPSLRMQGEPCWAGERPVSATWALAPTLDRG
ncbi:hypothetical protein mRhiFer1_009652 [Rhinolophus ferrumequinum]|uniref:Uncharacterized protein n=1 Tax=Rhinolophus ferrumequinum TaxID=59479 RepID=A0A7J7R6B1_RHIFE|nr:hypothetical protein mRhiFer1_009652 [Rhinolophus ferrumequinum]